MNQYQLADLNFNLYGLNYEYTLARMNEYLTKEASCDIKFLFESCCDIPMPVGHYYKKLFGWQWKKSKDQYISYQCHPITKEVVSLITCDNDFKNIHMKLCEFENEYGITNNRRSFFAIGHIFNCIILKHNGLVFHSSAIDYKGNGILFSAPPETGKSTHTAAWTQYYPEDTAIINDDTPALRMVNGVWYAFGTPWSGKTVVNCNRSVPLRAIVFMEQSVENKIQRIKGARAVSLMLNETRKSVFPELMDLATQTISKIMDSIPIYLLSCNISKEAVDLVKDTLDL